MLKHVLLFSFLFLSLSFVNAQTYVNVIFVDNTETTYMVNKDGKLYFSDSEVFIESSTGDIVALAFDEIRKMNFEDATAGIDSQELSNSCILFPNPASDNIVIHKDANDGDLFEIMFFSLDGRLVLSGYY
jgi:hypothetical protein